MPIRNNLQLGTLSFSDALDGHRASAAGKPVENSTAFVLRVNEDVHDVEQ